MRTTILRLLALVAAVVSVMVVQAQLTDEQLPDTVPPWFNRGDVPDWDNDPEYKKDVFTFVRVAFRSRRDWRGRGKWMTDYPDSDLNFSLRLQQLTTIKVDPQPIVLTLTDPRLFEYPFIYMCEPGDIMLDDDEVKALRRYLDNGGFLMVDDFWGEDEWYQFYTEIKRVFPDREPIELPLEHDIFQNSVYPLKERPQVPAIQQALGGRSSGRTWERWDAQEVHYRAILDDQERIMVMICHNTDLGDGWEREGEHEWYFEEFSVKKAYPLGINIVTYAMTH
ncbi:MAG: DUF4159 domain-containing protein [Planctomycetales bacterium]|nr:DUF4159 domain-containing protein [Planctomycetales bacterium]